MVHVIEKKNEEEGEGAKGLKTILSTEVN